MNVPIDTRPERDRLYYLVTIETEDRQAFEEQMHDPRFQVRPLRTFEGMPMDTQNRYILLDVENPRDSDLIEVLVRHSSRLQT